MLHVVFLLICSKQATQKIQASKDTEVNPNSDDQAISKTVTETEDKNAEKNEQPSDHVVNGKGISFFCQL